MNLRLNLPQTLAAIALSLWSLNASSAASCSRPWPLWEDFAKLYIQADGRVIDHNADGISTSEGQSYALFFSLVANDREKFDNILKWTGDNLAQSDMYTNLPAWKWGKSGNGSWTALDYNAASDADMWMAYSLLHAAKYWKHRPYQDLGMALLRNIAKREVADLPRLGAMLLPGPYGFPQDSTTWRLNPSYMPIQLLRFFSTVDKNGPWDEVARNTGKMLTDSAVNGVVADWVFYNVADGFKIDPYQGEYSSYDAIRVYLWWAMLDQRDPLFASLRTTLSKVSQFTPDNTMLPERINMRNGEGEGAMPIGFTAALAPYRYVLYQQKLEQAPSLNPQAGYYNYVLSLFGYGWMEQRFHFNVNGNLTTEQHKKCAK